MNTGKRFCILFLFLILKVGSFGQITSGKIVYERKTNLEKKFKGNDGEWLDEFLKINKYKTDLFDLNFNDSISFFKSSETDEQDPISWTTEKNSTYQNFNSNIKYSILNISDEIITIKDVVVKREWKITESKRMIGKYECRKAFVQLNDSTKIYAWFSNEILPSIGPEGFCGLPGAILGLATEDGGIVYFAKSVQIMELKVKDLDLNLKKKKTISFDEYRLKMKTIFGETKEDLKDTEELIKWL